MTSVIPLPHEYDQRTPPAPPSADGSAVEFTVTVRISVAPGHDTDVAARFAERLRAALEPSPTPVLRLATVTSHERPTVPASASLCVDVPSRTVRLRGVELELTRLEFELLLYLTHHRGTVVTRRTLLADVWATADHTKARTVDVHIRRLRSRLGREFPLITTVRGIGYRLDDSPYLAVRE
jgi:DNA-binding response OmpR family regulator